ncbi:putative transcriptional regulator [Tessaracoccus oleiagri]|uniref:Putative transcriptional regulator n=1 Tax=Tessaracoccus oleiagri TaxID=686624 RepID=A0A1G9H4N5_9ACTN|nr:putative transcriptional regulator [Tessaracoccus oleiagri]
MPIAVRIEVELAKRKLLVGEFAEGVGISPVNIAVLKNGHPRAVLFRHPRSHV